MNRLPCTDALSKIHDGAERIKASHFVLHIITIKKKKKKSQSEVILQWNS